MPDVDPMAARHQPRKQDGMSMIEDHRAQGKPQQRGRWSWAFMRRDLYDGPGQKWTRNRFLIGKPGNPMMERWRLIQTPLFGVYVHFIYREDLDPVPHDHPWRFWSLVLRGEYTEMLVPDARSYEGIGLAHTWRRWSRHHVPLGAAPVVPSVGAVPVEEGSALARMLETYLTTRGHTLSTAHLTGMEQMLAEAEYVLGEAQELRDAVVAMAEAHERGEATSEHLRAIRHEVADVALADTTFASLMPGSVTVELCIAEKTEADRDRG